VLRKPCSARRMMAGSHERPQQRCRCRRTATGRDEASANTRSSSWLARSAGHAHSARARSSSASTGVRQTPRWPARDRLCRAPLPCTAPWPRSASGRRRGHHDADHRHGGAHADPLRGRDSGVRGRRRSDAQRDPAALAARLTSRTKAIVVTHRSVCPAR
jgi:hypothetical protein